MPAIPEKYTLSFTPNFEDKTFVAQSRIDISIPADEEIDQIQLDSGDLKIDFTGFYWAEHIFRGNPNYIGYRTMETIENGVMTLPLPNKFNASLIAEGGYVEVKHKGSMEMDGLKFEDGILETHFENNNGKLVFPNFEGTPAITQLFINVPNDTKIEVGDNLIRDTDYEEDGVVKYHSNGEKIMVSDVYFKIFA